MPSGSDLIPTNSPFTSIFKCSRDKRGLLRAWEGGFYEENRSYYQAFQAG
jgi:hypothetical protein